MYLNNNIIDLCAACDTVMQFHPKCTVEQILDNCVTHNSQKDTPKLGHLSFLTINRHSEEKPLYSSIRKLNLSGGLKGQKKKSFLIAFISAVYSSSQMLQFSQRLW